MSDERDKLTEVIAEADGSGHFLRSGRRHAYGPLADAILAAGYRKPQQVTTVEELDALPDMSVVRTSAGTIANLVGDAAYFFGYDASAPRSVLALPATVLHVGGAE